MMIIFNILLSILGPALSELISTPIRDELDRPKFQSEVIDDKTYAVGAAIASWNLPEATGRNRPIKYSLNPEVPGISFSAAERSMSGTPTESGNFLMKYTARDKIGKEADLSFRIIVVERDTEPTFGDQTLKDETFTIGETLTPRTLPEATGGNRPLTYSLTPIIPDTSFDSSERVLSGILSEAGTFRMTYTARDRDGDQASLNSTITVERYLAKLYWADTRMKKIQRANLDGTEVEDLVASGLDEPVGSIATYGSKLYWTDAGTDKIQRANLDGTEVEALVSSGLDDPKGISIYSGKMYWADVGTDKIQRANLDGTDVEDLVTSGLDFPGDVAIYGGKMYWTDAHAEKIQRANLDGTEIEDLVIEGLDYPRGIAIYDGKMYWTDARADKIQRANLDGTEIEDLVTEGLDYPGGIAIYDGKMYWTDARADKIQRANLDGTEVEDLVQSLISPYGIAIR